MGPEASTLEPDPTGALPLLLIYRETIKPGREAAYCAVEEEIARICHELRCPHPYLGAAAAGTPTEVWFFNGFRIARGGAGGPRCVPQECGADGRDD